MTNRKEGKLEGITNNSENQIENTSDNSKKEKKRSLFTTRNIAMVGEPLAIVGLYLALDANTTDYLRLGEFTRDYIAPLITYFS